MNEAWFARRFAVGDARKAMGPIAWQGWAAFAAFTVALVAAGLTFLLLSIVGMMAFGVIVFAALAGAAGYALMKVVALKGDQTRCIADYRDAPPAKSVAPAAAKEEPATASVTTGAPMKAPMNAEETPS